MKISFTKIGWQDYLYSKRYLKRINLLIHAILREPFKGIGDPEPLKYDLSGYWSRRIDQEHRLVYEFKNDHILIIQCRYHY